MGTGKNDRTFVYVTYIATTADKLWEALTTSAFTEQYFFKSRVESDWQVGSTVTFTAGGEKTVTGTVLVSDRPKLLSYTWLTPERSEPSRITFELKPMGPVVKLTALHEELRDDDFEADRDKWRGVNNGWPAILSNLKSVLETGKPCLVFATPPRPEARQS